jgi:hypothetical protein
VACAYGRLEVAQWLGAASGVYVHAKDDVAFRKTCRYGHLHVAKWVFGLGGVDIHADGDDAFRNACVDKHADTARWLISLGLACTEDAGPAGLECAPGRVDAVRAEELDAHTQQVAAECTRFLAGRPP